MKKRFLFFGKRKAGIAALSVVLLLGGALIFKACTDRNDDDPPPPEVFVNELRNDKPQHTTLNTIPGSPIDPLTALYETGSDIRPASIILWREGDIVYQTGGDGFAPDTPTNKITESSEREVYRKLNAGTSFNLLGIVGFSAGVKNTTHSTKSNYVMVFKSKSILGRVFANNSPAFLAERLNPQTVEDLLQLNASQFLTLIKGPFIITDAEIGITADLRFYYHGSEKTDKTKITSGFNAIIDNINAGGSLSWTEEAKEIKNNSDLYIYTYGGANDFLTENEFFEGYKDWFANAKESPGFIGTKNYVPVWEVFFAYAATLTDPVKAGEIIKRAEALRTVYYDKAIRKGEELEWMSPTIQQITALGGNMFYLPAEPNGALRQIKLRVIGGGGGGGGGATGGTLFRTNYPGGGGGSSGGVKTGFITSGDIELEYFVGKGGSGGGRTDSPNTNVKGKAGQPGQDSWVKYGNVTITANGGQPGNENNSRNGGAGGTHSKNPGPSFNVYEAFDGKKGGNGSGYSSGGPGGKDTAIDGYSGGAGGRGGKTYEGDGKTGGNGKIVIEWFTL
ncbi:MAG: hypothetical protein LBH44_02745 [Treponema sp.]|jgi:hypothetical protein|nr:hypothetical protein [Treponema sp.]